MSYDLCFWRETVKHEDSPTELCARLSADEEPEGIACLSVDDIKAKFAEFFPEISDGGTQLDWEGAGRYFQVSWPISSKPRRTLAIFVSCGYELLKSPETMNRIIDVATSLGCALYDPQTDERYLQPEQDPG